MTKIGNEPAGAQALHPHLTWLYRAGAVAALLTGLLFFLAALSLSSTLLQPGSWSGAFSTFQDNWLIIIFKLHAGFRGVGIGSLQVLNYLDIAILVLVGVTMLGLYAALRRISRLWSLVAAIQPFLGLVLFMATRSAGRSAVMGAALVISLVMLRPGAFKQAIAYLGIATSVVLLVGDFSAGILSSATIAILFGIAYMLFIAWLLLVALRLFQLGKAGSQAGLQ